MNNLLLALTRLALGLWAGAMAIVIVVAVRAFHSLGTADAPRFLAPIFRTVDLYGVGAAILATIAFRASPWRAILVAGAGAGALINTFALAPRIADRAEHFEFYHRASEGLWAFALVSSGILLLAWPRPVA